VPYPDKILASDEDVVLHLNPHWRRLVRPVFAFLVAVGCGSFAAGYTDAPATRAVVAVLVVTVVLGLAVWPVLRWTTSHVIVTTHRLILRTGVLARSGYDVPLGRVNDISFRHSLLERLLGSGTLTVESSSERGRLVLRDVPHVEAVQGILYQLIETRDVARAVQRPPEA
jgi:uncharacterized membrane protein YdbT with pleckstrin-like domain